MRDRASRILGIEPDPEARRVAIGKGIRVVAGTAELLPAETAGERFDIVLMCHVLEHCIDPELALRNAKSLLSEGGSIFVETPNNRAAGLDLLGSSWSQLDVPRHLNFFTERSLKLLAERAGLVVVAVSYAHFVRQFVGERIGEEQRREQLLSGRKLRRSRWSWLLLETAFARAERKYDSVRLQLRPR